jgi:hypothetical protein
MGEDKDVARKVGWAIRELANLYEPTTLDIRAENAFGVAIRFFQLIIKMIPEEEEQKKLISSWFKSVRDNDFRKFRKSLRKYDRFRISQEENKY